MPGTQFPYPRKSSNPPKSYASYRLPPHGKSQALKTYGPPILGVVTLIWVLLHFVGGASSPVVSKTPSGTPSVVIVTTLDPRLPGRYTDAIKDNRRDYAARHGYATFFPNTTDYDVGPYPERWSVLPALRHAMKLYPHATWMWYLSSTALIMNSTQSLEAKLLAPRKLESLMIVDQPVVPPDSVIKTFPNIKGERVEFILSQDSNGLASESMLIRTGDWAKFLLDLWFDPLFRSYHFQKAEQHALEHMVQWHMTILAKMALVPQKVLNSYTAEAIDSKDKASALFEDGDFVANFHGCNDAARNCEQEMQPLLSRSQESRSKTGRAD